MGLCFSCFPIKQYMNGLRRCSSYELYIEVLALKHMIGFKHKIRAPSFPLCIMGHIGPAAASTLPCGFAFGGPCSLISLCFFLGKNN